MPSTIPPSATVAGQGSSVAPLVVAFPPQPETPTSRAAARRVERILLGGGSTVEEKVMAHRTGRSESSNEPAPLSPFDG